MRFLLVSCPVSVNLCHAATMDAHVGFESWGERDVAMMLDFDPNVVGFSSQPFWLIWTQADEERRHAADYFARLADGSAPLLLSSLG